MPGNSTPFLRLHELALLRLDTQSSLLLTSLDLYLVLYHDIQAQVVPLLHPLFSSTHWQKITHQSRMSLTRWKACCTQKGKKFPHGCVYVHARAHTCLLKNKVHLMVVD